MTNTLPKAKRLNNRPALVYGLVAVVVVLVIAIAAILLSGDLFSTEPTSDAERDYELLLEGLEDDPKNPAILMTLAEAEFTLGKNQDAFGHAAAAVRYGEDTPGLRLRYAGILVQDGQVAKAKVLVEEEIALETPGDPEPFFLMAQIERETGDIEAALSSIKQGLKIAPTAADMIILHADLLRESGDEKGAITQYKRALRFLPGDARATEGLKQLGVEPPANEETQSPHGGSAPQ